MKRIKIIVADPETGNVWADHLELSLAMLQAQVGCRSVELVAVGADVYMYVDGEGCYRQPDEQGRLPQIWFRGANQPIVGRAVFVGPPDQDGDETSVPATVEQVKQAVERFVLEPLPPIPPPQVIVLDRGE